MKPMQEKKVNGWTLTNVAASIAGMLIVFLLVVTPGYGQGLPGHWMAVGKTLDNGEQQKSILELKQSGNELTGVLKSQDYSFGVKGTAKGNHFVLYGPGNPNKPLLVGDLVNGELH